MGSSRAPGRQMLQRVLALAGICGLLFLTLLLVRLWQLQIVQHDELESRAIAQQLRDAPTTAARGSIYDCKGRPLAVSASVDNVYLSPAEIDQYGENREQIAGTLSELLGLDRAEVLEKSRTSGAWYVTVARKVEREQAEAVRRFIADNGIHGVHLETDTKRYYPNSSLACHVIGFVGTDNTGLEGIEARYDEALSGTAGRTRRATNAYGTELIYTAFEDYIPGEDGCDLEVTIDAAIQYYIEKQLRQAVSDYDILNGAGAICMDVNTGAILAMASLDGYDLNNFLAVSPQAQAVVDAASTKEEAQQLLQRFQMRQWRNKALSDTYEPGSTFKIITLSMALEEGAVHMDDSFYCGGSVNVVGRGTPIRCWKDGGHGSQTLTQAVQHSCNAAFVNIAQRVGAETFYDYCEAFGFLNQREDPDESLTATTGIDLSGESGSIWWSHNVFCSEKNLSQLAAASFGQTFTITPLQLITAVSAAVNGGRLYQPYVVAKLTDGKGAVTYEREPRLVRQVISEETSRQVREILEQVVGDPKDGTGHNAAVAGYRIGGKTGTSEKVTLEAQTGQKEYIVSFLGFAPADDPQIAILIFLDTPSNASGIYISGGQMAAPVVGRMMADILPYLGVQSAALSEPEADVTVPDLTGQTRQGAAETVRGANLRYRTLGEGDTVTGQLPAPGSTIAKNSEILLYFNRTPSTERETVPELTGMSYERARDLLSDYAIYISSLSPVSDAAQIIGSQSMAPGTRAEHGNIVSVTLQSADGEMLGRY